MARAPQARAAQPSAEDDFYGEETDEVTAQGQGGSGQDGQEGDGLSEDAAVDTGEEQEAGGAEDLDDPLLDFLDDPSTGSGRQTRGETRQQQLANENRRLADRIALLEQQGRQPAQTQPTGPREETEQEFTARLAMLSPEERMEARHERWVRQQTFQNQRTHVQAVTLADKTAFDSKAAADGRYARWQDKVEAEFNKFTNQGMFVPRENILKYLLGEALLSRAGSKGLKEARTAAQRRVERNTVRASNAGSDVRPNRRERLSPAEARVRRLEGVQI